MSAEGVLRVGTSARAALRREALFTGAFALASAATAALVLAWQRLPAADPVTSGGIVVLAGVVALVLEVRRRDAVWGRFTVKVSPDVLEAGPEGDTRRITRAEVRHAVRAAWPARGLVLVGKAGIRSVFVPEGIERFDAVLAEVSHWGAIERSRVPDSVARAWPLLTVAAVAIEAVALGSRSAVLVSVAAAVLAGVTLWSLGNVLRSKRIGLRGRALSLLLLVPVAFVVWRAVGLWGG